MEPLTRSYRNRRLSPLPLSTLSSLRPSKPFPINTNSFTNTENIPQNLNNHTSTREGTATNTLSNLSTRRVRMEQELPLIKAQVKCQYCNESFESEQILAHVNECEMQRIACEKCGDRVPMEIYDIHFEECESMSRRMEAIELRVPRRRRVSLSIEGEDNRVDNTRIASVLFSGGDLSYEQLLLLDETIEKKGLSPEEMLQYKVQLYVKSLDGEGSCNICISEYETAEYTRELPCKHKFHRDCVDKWLEANITCPTCKMYLR